MARTLFDKIWDAHTVNTVDGGPTQLYIDRHYCHEVTSPQAFDGLRRRGLQYALGCENHFDLACAYAKSYGSESISSGAHYCIARECKTCFRSYDMYDTVSGVTEAEQCQSELICVAVQCLDLLARHGVIDGLVLMQGRYIVVGRAYSALRTIYFQPSPA